MNPLTNVHNLNKINQTELKLGVAGSSTSWHAKYKDSAWIYVGGLLYDLTEGDILRVFSQYGEIVNINLVRDQKTGKSKGFCFICYEDQRSTILAVDNINGFKLLGRVLRVDHVENYRQPKEKGGEDEVTQKLREQGCAPRVQSSEGEDQSEEEVLLAYDTEEKKKKKSKKEKKKKVKKEKKKKAKKSESESDENVSSHRSQDSGVRIKQERLSPDSQRSERNSQYRLHSRQAQGTERVKQEDEQYGRKRVKQERDSVEHYGSNRRRGDSNDHNRDTDSDSDDFRSKRKKEVKHEFEGGRNGDRKNNSSDLRHKGRVSEDRDQYRSDRANHGYNRGGDDKDIYRSSEKLKSRENESETRGRMTEDKYRRSDKGSRDDHYSNRKPNGERDTYNHRSDRTRDSRSRAEESGEQHARHMQKERDRNYERRHESSRTRHRNSRSRSRSRERYGQR